MGERRVLPRPKGHRHPDRRVVRPRRRHVENSRSRHRRERATAPRRVSCRPGRKGRRHPGKHGCRHVIPKARMHALVSQRAPDRSRRGARIDTTGHVAFAAPPRACRTGTSCRVRASKRSPLPPDCGNPQTLLDFVPGHYQRQPRTRRCIPFLPARTVPKSLLPSGKARDRAR